MPSPTGVAFNYTETNNMRITPTTTTKRQTGIFIRHIKLMASHDKYVVEVLRHVDPNAASVPCSASSILCRHNTQHTSRHLTKLVNLVINWNVLCCVSDSLWYSTLTLPHTLQSGCKEGGWWTAIHIKLPPVRSIHNPDYVKAAVAAGRLFG